MTPHLALRQRNPYDRKREAPYRDSFRHETHCWACGQESDTVVGAHCNLGAGAMGSKHEGCIAALCSVCHARADQGTLFERNEIWRQVAQKLMLDRYAGFRFRKGEMADG